MNSINPKSVAGALTLGLLFMILWPVRLNWVKSPKDSFPLTHYPMFSHLRNGQAEMTYMVGVGQDQRRVYLSYEMAGTGGMNQVRKVIRKRAAKDPAKLCAQVAKRVAKSSEYRTITKVKIMKGEFLFDTFFSGDSTPLASEVLCTCDVNRKPENKMITAYLPINSSNNPIR